MTWTRALPVLAVAVVFDATRFFFENLGIFGPALAGIGTAAFLHSYIGGTVVGNAVSGAAGSVAAVGSAFFFSAAIELFGLVMGIVLAFTGWILLFLLILITNFRFYTENRARIFWMIAGFMVSEIPFIGAVPAMTITVAPLYRHQIKKERSALKKWQIENATVLAQEKKQRALQIAFAQNRKVELEAQYAAQQQAEADAEAANDNTQDMGYQDPETQYAEHPEQPFAYDYSAANDNTIPETRRNAA